MYTAKTGPKRVAIALMITAATIATVSQSLFVISLGTPPSGSEKWDSERLISPIRTAGKQKRR